MTQYYIIMGIIFVVSLIVQNRLKSKFEKYSKTYLKNGMSGKEIAEQMLLDHRIYDVKVISTPGQLTDHYDPIKKTVNLSEAVYSQRNAAAAAVAAHECGHAVQHAVSYAMLTLRSKMVPAVQLSSSLLHWVFIAGIFMASRGVDWVFQLGVALFAVTTLFSFVTLPVEYDASRRALHWLERKHITTRAEHLQAKDALQWAARTYVVAALGSAAQLMWFLSQLSGRRD